MMKRRTLDTEDLWRRPTKRTKSSHTSDESDAEVGSDNDEDNEQMNEPRQSLSQDHALSDLSRFKSKMTYNALPEVPKSRQPTSFADLGISTPLQTALERMSIRSPTEVQTSCIPVLLAGAFRFLHC